MLGYPQLIVKNDQIQLNDLEDQSYNYILTLILENSEKYQPIINLIFNQRKKYSTKNIMLINRILQIAVLDVKFLQYIVNLPCHNYIEHNMIYFFMKIVNKYQEDNKSMIYNMESFTRVNSETLSNDTLNLLEKNLTLKRQESYIYGK